MANELNIALPTSGLTVTAQPYQSGSAVGSAISLTEVGSSGFYSGDMTGSAGTYQLAFISAGANVGSGSIVWSGTAEVASSAPSVVQISQEMDSNSTKLANLDASVSSRSTLTSGDLPSVPTAADNATAVRAELTELSNLDATVSSRLAAADYIAPTAAPTVSDIRTELATELANLDAAVSSRSTLTTGDIPSADITAIKAKTDLLNSDRLANVATTNIVGTLLAQAHS